MNNVRVTEHVTTKVVGRYRTTICNNEKARDRVRRHIAEELASDDDEKNSRQIDPLDE